MNDLKLQIKLEDFEKIDMRMGTVLSAEGIEGSDKLIKMEVDFGDTGKRQILAGIKAWYKIENLVGKQLPFVLNIEPREMMGLESQGMILAVDYKDKAVVLLPQENTENGAVIR